MTFLPNNERAPEGNYMKLVEGDNTFRITSSAVTGYEYWNKEDKPVRLKKEPTSTPEDIRMDNGKPSRVKYFWAFTVYNYRAQKQQILELTAVSIQNAIRALVQNKAWGDPKEYDITIKRVGSGLGTEYSVMPNPKSSFPADLVGGGVNLEALFSGGDPFAPNATPEFLQ